MESNQGSTSVLFALGELRDIEVDRVRTQEEREAELEAERMRLQLEREEVERQREEQRRFELELLERRASIEAQMKLEERRIALELERIPAPSLDALSRPKWPWLMSMAVLALAGMQFLMWQTQKGLDKSIAEVRGDLADKPPPVYFDERAPEPAPTPAPTPARTVAPAPAANPIPAPKRHPKLTVPTAPPEAIDCDNTKDPLGCLPK